MFYIPVNNFSVMSGQLPVFLCWTSTKQRIKCLAHGHNTVILQAASLKLATFGSQSNAFSLPTATALRRFLAKSMGRE